MNKQFYIKERLNPQFNKPYYVAEGQLTKKEAKSKEATLYGSNYLLAYNTEQEYKNAIEKLRVDGFKVMGEKLLDIFERRRFEQWYKTRFEP